MPALLRNMLALLAGALVAGVLISLVQGAAAWCYPLPEGVTPENREAFANYVAGLPPGAFLLVLLSYATGTFAGTWMAVRLSATRHLRQGVLVGALLLSAGVSNLLHMPHPWWFWMASLAVFPVLTWAGVRLGLRQIASGTPAPDA